MQVHKVMNKLVGQQGPRALNLMRDEIENDWTPTCPTSSLFTSNRVSYQFSLLVRSLAPLP